MNRASAMSRAEKRFLWIEDILSWCHGKYTREELEKMDLPTLGTVHAEVYMKRIAEMNTIRV